MINVTKFCKKNVQITVVASCNDSMIFLKAARGLFNWGRGGGGGALHKLDYLEGLL